MTTEPVLISNSCSDDEYVNSRNGLCTFKPVSGKLFDCASSNFTQTGLCISSASQTQCTSQWISKATTSSACLSKGVYCEHPSGKLSLLSAEACRACGGTSKNRYTWTGDAATPTPDSQTNVPDVQTIAQDSIGKQVTRKILNDFYKHLNTYTNLFKAFACDCVEKRGSCFDKPAQVEDEECVVDPAVQTQCGGAYFSPSQTTSKDPLIITAFTYSASNYLKSQQNTTTVGNTGVQESNTVTVEPSPATGSSPSVMLSKRCNPLSDYEVVVSGGQIIGNGVSYTTSSDSYKMVTICLSTDKSIPTNKVKYPYYDIGIVFGGQVYAQYLTASFDGSKVCGDVYKFPDIVYIPILRS